MKKKIIIIGCGFAGLFASRQFLRLKAKAEITVIDKKETFDFLPLLPDLIGRDIDPELLTCPIRLLSERLGFDFINEEALSIDTENNTVRTKARKLDYDYLLCASGSETNFYGKDEIRRYAFKLDDAGGARAIIRALKNKDFSSFVISGGGYTGVEAAANLKVYLSRRNINKKVIIVEKEASILSVLPQWIRAFAADNLKRMGIECLTNTVVDEVREETLSLSSGKAIKDSMLIWTAGVRTADFIQGLSAEKNAQGRIKVDEYLRLKENCFAAGDAAYFPHKGVPLRMAVHFAIYGGLSAARNIMKSIEGKPPIEFRPFDLGYIVPMANNRSCGRVLGFNVRGRLATALHFTMCVYRSYGLKHKLGIIRDLLTGGKGYV